MRDDPEGGLHDDAFYARLVCPKQVFTVFTVTIPTNNLAVRTCLFYSFAAYIAHLL